MATSSTNRNRRSSSAESIDMNEVNKLFEDVYAEEKQSTLEGNIELPTKGKANKYSRTLTMSGHSTTSTRTPTRSRQSHSISRNSSVTDIDSASKLPAKAYCIAGYQILLHLLLLYCVGGITYLLWTNNSKAAHCECSQIMTESGSTQIYTEYNNNTVSCECAAMTDIPSLSPTESPSVFPTGTPTKKPSVFPSTNPTHQPSSSSPTAPSTRPTLQPTQASAFSVGDYKISAQNVSHGNWKLCDGSFLDSAHYPELFDVISNSFGSFSGYPSLFALPNKTNQIGMISYFETGCPDGWQTFAQSNGRFIVSAGLYSTLSEDNRMETQNYTSGEIGGEIRHKLGIGEIPSHNHIVSGQDNYAAPAGRASNEVANVENYPSYFTRTTSSTGGGNEHNNMPPYLVLHACKMHNNLMENVFILAKTV